MDKKMKFKYFYGAEADQFSFYRISLMSVRGYGESESPSRDLPGGMP